MADIADYLLAADNHNYGNVGTSWLNPLDWGTKFGNVGKFSVDSILSGANSFYNTAVSVGNYFGANLQENDTAEWISSIDSDLGAYYRANQSSVDLVGFVLGSVVPGLGGIKILNAGQRALQVALDTGKIGGNLAKATGLLVPNSAKYVTLAAQEINASTTGFKLLNLNTTQALGRGLWQNTLEAAAFETVVQASMFKSPVLENQTLGDVISNVMIGGAVGGVIGGAFGAAKIFGSLKTAVNAEGTARLPFQSRPAFAEITSPSEKIISLSFNNEQNLVPRVFSAGENLVDPKLIQGRIEANNNGIRTAIHEVTSGDKDLGNMVANAAHGAPSSQYLADFSGAVGISRVSEMSKAELTAAKAVAKGEVPDSLSNRYVTLIGETTGKVTDGAPVIKSLADTLATPKEVLAAVKEYRFGPDKFWSAMYLKGPNAHTEAEARYIYMETAKPFKEGAAIHAYDIPALQKAYMDNTLDIRIVDPSDLAKPAFIPSSRAELFEYIKNTKVEVANEMLLKMSYKGDIPIEQGTAAAAKIANVKQSYLEGTRGAVEWEDIMANEAAQSAYTKAMKAKGFSADSQEIKTSTMLLPKTAKITYKIDDDIAGAGGTIADAITLFKTKQQLYQENAKNVVAKILGKDADVLADISDRELMHVLRTGEGASLLASDNSKYGGLGSIMSRVGVATKEFIQAQRKMVSDTLEGPLVALGTKPEAALEVAGMNQKITRSGKLWVRHTDEDGVEYIVTKNAVKQYSDEGALNIADVVNYSADEIIQIKNAETAKFWDAHIQTSGGRTDSFKEIRAAQGFEDVKDPSVIRPIQRDLRLYPHFAFVKDPTVTGTGHTSMIFAASEKELQALADKVPAQYKVVYKAQTEDFFKARSEYEFSRTLHENYFDSELASKGIASDFFPKSDPQKIIDDILQQHYRESDTLVRETIRLRYEPQFNWLEDMGKQHSQTETSRFATKTEMVEKTTNNPYFNYIKTALDISKANEYHLIYGLNKLLDESVSKAVGSIRNAWNGVRTPDELGKINTLLDEYGIKPAYYDASLQALANHTAPRGELTKFVRGANSLLSLFTLGLDPLNALNNAIGSNILRGTETKFLVNAIRSGNTELAGDLGKLGKITTPGTGDSILSPTKLHAQAIRNFWQDARGDKSLIEKYKDMGLIKDRVEQLKLLVDDFTLKGTESVKDLADRTNTAFGRAKLLAEKGEKLSGNKLAEEFNRFISANVMDQLTGLGIKHGLIDEATAGAYINTFVNRVEGNIAASQRPLIFQGPIGQAVSLFQSYQFNLLQQLFRYVAEGSKKDLATLVGLQSTLYGAQSLPAFQFINTHIVGQLSGNKEHTDAYDAVYGAVGRNAGDWMLYGIPSNLIKANIYSRGDINPRQITVLPTSMQEIPLVAGWGKFLLNMKETVEKIAGGGNIWESVLQGIEHNGISRPLAGMAQVFQGFGPGGQPYSTSNKGSILYSNDLFSWASMVRLAGGRPLDEAVTNDALFRVRSYEAARKKAMSSLAETVKTTLIKGESSSESQIQNFAKQYAALGGKQTGFNTWMMGLYKNANVPQAQQLEMSLKTPFSHKMQLLMGGDDE
jgi:hypothetical protein